MTFKEKIKQKEAEVKANPEVKNWLDKVARNMYGNVSTTGDKPLTDYQYGFMLVLEEEAESGTSSIWNPINRKKIVEAASDFYGDGRVTDRHIEIIGINPPTEEENKWEICYSDTLDGEFMAYLKFEEYKIR